MRLSCSSDNGSFLAVSRSSSRLPRMETNARIRMSQANQGMIDSSCGQVLPPYPLVTRLTDWLQLHCLHIALVLELYAAQLQAQCLACQVVELVCRRLVGQTFRAYVGNAVARTVQATHSRGVGQVQVEAVWRGQAWTFADHDNHLASTQCLTDAVANRHAALLGKNHRSVGPVGIEALAKGLQQRQGMALHGDGR